MVIGRRPSSAWTPSARPTAAWKSSSRRSRVSASSVSLGVSRLLRHRIASFLIPTSFWCVLAVVGVSYSAQAAAEKVFTAKQGEVLYLTVLAEGNPASVQGRLRDRSIPFFKTGREGEFGALVGIDMAGEPATGNLPARVTY